MGVLPKKRSLFMGDVHMHILWSRSEGCVQRRHLFLEFYRTSALSLSSVLESQTLQIVFIAPSPKFGTWMGL